LELLIIAHMIERESAFAMYGKSSLSSLTGAVAGGDAVAVS